MKTILVLIFSLFTITNEGSNLKQFKEDLEKYVSQWQEVTTWPMPIKKYEIQPMPNVDLYRIMIDPDTKLKYYPDKKVIIDNSDNFMYDLKSNKIFDLQNGTSFPAEGLDENFYNGRKNLLKE